LFGVFDGEGYNDFETPSFSQYTLTEGDHQFNILSPRNYSKLWKLTHAETDDLTKVFGIGMNVTEASQTFLKSYFAEWSQDEETTSVSGQMAHLAYCGFVSGEDKTFSLLEANNQDGEAQTSRRKKRQAEQTESPVNDNQQPAWPTPKGKTREWANEYCVDALNDVVLQSCSNAIFRMENTLRFSDIINDCISDIQASDDTVWVSGSKEAIVELCKEEINKNPLFQLNENSNELANTFMDTTCSPMNCSGKGSCSRGVCYCQPDYIGNGCQYHKSNVPTPSLISPPGEYSVCQIGNDFTCSAAYVRGTNFINSRFLTCHLREVELSGGKMRQVPGSAVTSVRGELINVDQVRCPLTNLHNTKRSVEVSVSNDGSKEFPHYQLFIAYDPACYSCRGYECFANPDVCTIGKKCMKEGEVSIYDDCKYCNLNNPTEWSIKTELPHCKAKITEVNDDEDTTLRTALIAACIALVVLVMFLVAAVCFFRGKSARPSSQPPAYDNQAYMRDYFNGRPIPAYNNENGMGNNLSKTPFPESA